MTARSTPQGSKRSRPAGAWSLVTKLLAYNVLLAALLPALILWLGWRVLVRRKSIGSWLHRLGIVPRLSHRPGPRIWLHAVSAGEMMAARPVLQALRRAFPEAAIAVSTITPAGMSVARQRCREADALFYLPFDWPDTIALAMWRVRPHLIVVAEKELWPNFLGLARLVGSRVLVVNGRVSDRMMGRARWAPGFVRWLYSLPHCLCVQSEQDAARLAALGVIRDRILLAGNTKVDTIADHDVERERRFAEETGVSRDDLWLVAGSTHPGEEEVILEAFQMIRSRLRSARLLLAPRHVERVPAVSAMVAERGISVVRRSEGLGEQEAVVILDTMGELGGAYAFGAVGFVGGTLVPVGGHNLLEPVAVGRPVLFGPYTENCADVADLVVEAGVGMRVRDARELADEFLRVAGDSALREQIAARAQTLIAQQRGAAERCARVAGALVEEGTLL